MTAMRRKSGGIALMLAYVLAVQSLAAGLALGLMAAAGAEPFAVICTSNGPVALKPEPGPGAPENSHLHELCGTLCQLASASPAALGSEGGFVSSPRQDISDNRFPAAEAPRSALPHSIAEARAPPLSN